MEYRICTGGSELTRAEQSHYSAPTIRHSPELFTGNVVAKRLNADRMAGGTPVISVRKDGFYYHTSDHKTIFLDNSLRGALVIARFIESTGISPPIEERVQLVQEAERQGRLAGIPDFSSREVYTQQHARA